MRLNFTSCAFYFFPLQLLTLSPHLLLMSELCYCQASFIEKRGIILGVFLVAYKDKKVSQFHPVLSASVLRFQLQIISFCAVMPTVLTGSIRWSRPALTYNASKKPTATETSDLVGNTLPSAPGITSVSQDSNPFFWLKPEVPVTGSLQESHIILWESCLKPGVWLNSTFSHVYDINTFFFPFPRCMWQWGAVMLCLQTGT